MSLSKDCPEFDLKAENIRSLDKTEKKSRMLSIWNKYSTIWNGLSSIFFIICLALFINNCVVFIKQYQQYNTIVVIEYKQPNETELPAVTICGNSIIYTDELKSKYTEYAIMDSKLGNTSLDNDKRAENKNYFLQKALKEHKALDIFQNISLNVKSLVNECYFKPQATRDINSSSRRIACEKIAQIVPSINDERKCFTFFSQLNTTEMVYGNGTKYTMVYEMNSLIHLEIPPNNKMMQLILIAIHSPDIIPTKLDFGYYLIYPKKFYDFRFNKHISHLKPPPYKTNCRHYYRTGPKGQRSRGDCINHCVKKETFKKCANYYGILTEDLLSNDDYICQRNDQNYTDFTNARKKCLTDCQPNCIEESYEILYAQEFNKPKSNNSIIEIKSDSTPYVYIYHKEELGEAEFIGSLGGNAHILLGLSAVKLFNLIVHFISHLKKAFGY